MTATIIEFAIVLAAILLGARQGGLAIGYWGGLGLVLLAVFFGVTPTAPPVDVMLIIIAVCMSAACMDAAGGLDFLVRIAARIIRSNPKYVSVIALIAVFFFISIMFPTIFAMGTKNLGTRKKLGGSYMIMAIVGGAIMPYFMGLIADYTHTAAAFLLPLCCFVCVVLYGAAYGRLVKE